MNSKIEQIRGTREVRNLVITADGKVIEAPEPEREGKYYTLEQMQEIVGGLIEMMSLPDGRHMILNEEGKLTSLPLNLMATALAGTSGVLGPSDYIAGDVLVCEDGRID